MESDSRTEIIFSLQGGMAQEGRVPAFTSLESIHGFAQALMMVVHFAQAGEIRRRNFKDLEVNVELTGTREGSFEFLIQISDLAPFLMQAYGEGLANGTWQLIRTVFRRAIGLDGDKDIDAAEDDGRINAGDLGALIQAVEPSLRKSHSVINHGSNNINIFVNGDQNSIEFDSRSKEYMHESIFNDETRSQRFLVTSFDGRNRTGRLFDLDDEQAYTFDLLAEADRRSLKVIADAAYAYTLRQKGSFHENMQAVCAFTSVDAPGGRKKRLKVFAAAKEFDDLEVGTIPDVTLAAPQIEDLSDNEDVIDDE